MSQPDLFTLGQQYLDAFRRECALYGVQVDPRLELRRGQGLLCYYNLADGHIYLSTPDFHSPTGKLQALFLRSLLGCGDNQELYDFLALFIPHIIAHELAHHLRHRYGQFGQSMWLEEQVANKLSVALVKRRLPPEAKKRGRELLRRAIDALSAQIEARNIAVDTYYSPLNALNVTGQIDTAGFENVELLHTLLGVPEETLLEGALTDELVDRLEQRGSLIDEIDHQYTADQIKYIYYHVGWLYLDLTSRETEYVEEFARNYLGLSANLLPLLPESQSPADTAVQACYRAHLDTADLSSVASRYFYKRYRDLLLARLESVDLQTPVPADQLRQEMAAVLESWTEGEADTLTYLSQLAPEPLRRLFPHRIAGHLPPEMDVAAALPSITDRRLWQYVVHRTADDAAANTLYRLEILDRTPVYRPLPAGLLLEMAHRFWLVKLAAGETIIWQGEYNDDVFFLIEGRLEVLVHNGHTDRRVAWIKPGDMFGEIAFFTEDPRYATVRAVEPSQCFVLTDANLQLLAFEHPAILMKMAGVLAKRLADTLQTGAPEVT